MRITILGSGPLAEPLAQLAQRAGHNVLRVDQDANASDADAAELVILAGSTAAVETILKRIAATMSQDAIVVDASIPTHDERRGDQAETAGTKAGWIAAMLPKARIVRAFASVPAEALRAVLARSAPDQPERLAVPIAGDDRKAKEAVEKFMREIGVEPFDLGALTNSDALNPGGALWGKALNQIEMLEAVGWLSGDG